MTTSIDEKQKRLILSAFRMPTPATMTSRKSSITNAFVGAVIPVITPSIEEIQEALAVLAMTPQDVRCAYCGDTSTEWDHLRPLVVNRRPTGFISEIANLVPSCGKCNQSKGNKPWRDWMLSNAKRSPTGRGLPRVQNKVALLEEYEKWKTPTQVEFEQIIGVKEWSQYWSLCDAINDELREAQQVANSLRDRVNAAISKKRP